MGTRVNQEIEIANHVSLSQNVALNLLTTATERPEPELDHHETTEALRSRQSEKRMAALYQTDLDGTASPMATHVHAQRIVQRKGPAAMSDSGRESTIVTRPENLSRTRPLVTGRITVRQAATKWQAATEKGRPWRMASYGYMYTDCIETPERTPMYQVRSSY